MKEYRIKVTVRNNLLLSAIEDAGYKSQAEFARDCNLATTAVNELVAMRKAPIGVDGEFVYAAKAIMEVLGACPTDLWTEEQLTLELRRNTAEKELSKEAIMLALQSDGDGLFEIASPEDAIVKRQNKQTIEETLDTLTRRESKVLKLRFGIDTTEQEGTTLEHIGSMFHLQRESIRQIEAKALRKMRHPSRSNLLKEMLEEK